MKRGLAVGIAAVIGGLGGAATADPAASVNLLTAVPTVVAVSSTVENPAILPVHAVDGKLDTAWNSLTGELAGAWIAVRIPADAHVDAIKLTVGFTKIDPKYGDLFTMNPRITRVRVMRDNLIVSEKTLDPAVRTLQDLAIGGPGGEYRVEVLEYVLGTRKDWREINISELEVWGKPGKATPASATKLAPVVHVGGFDHDDLTRAQCVTALFGGPKGIKVAHFETDDLSGDLSICRVEQALTHATEGAVTSDTGSVTIGIVKRAARPILVAKLPGFATSSSTGGESMGVAPTSTSIAVAAIALTTAESGLLVTETSTEQGMQFSKDAAFVQLFRISATGAVAKVLEYGWTNYGSTNGSTTQKCSLDAPTPGAKLPTVLDVRCQVHHERYGGNGPDDVTSDTERVDHYKWDGKIYAGP